MCFKYYNLHLKKYNVMIDKTDFICYKHNIISGQRCLKMGEV